MKKTISKLIRCSCTFVLSVVLAFCVPAQATTQDVTTQQEMTETVNNDTENTDTSNDSNVGTDESEIITDPSVSTTPETSETEPGVSTIKLSMEQNKCKVTFKWNEIEDASYYQLRVHSKNADDLIKKVHIEEKTVKLEYKTTYIIKVTAFNEEKNIIGESEKYTVYLPGQAKNVYTMSLSQNKVRVTWDKVKKADFYLVYRRNAGETKWKRLGKVTSTKYLDQTVKYNTIYKYQVIPVTKSNKTTFRGLPQYIRFCNQRIVDTGHLKYSYAEMSGDISLLADKYHDACTYEIIGKSEDNRNIYDVIIGNPNAKKTLMVVSTLHAREYMASQLCMRQIEYYMENYKNKIGGKKISSTLDEIAIHYIPMANPDGVTISQFGISGIRDANLRQLLYQINTGSASNWKANARGVDLNRNFPGSFKVRERRGPEGYSGPSAASESETQAVVKLLKQLKADGSLQGVVNYHAFGSIVFGYDYGSAHTEVTTRQMYYLARNLTGYADSAGYESTVNTGSWGNLREYITEDLRIPSITLEIGWSGCPVPISQFPGVWSRNYSLVMREAMLFV